MMTGRWAGPVGGVTMGGGGMAADGAAAAGGGGLMMTKTGEW